MKFHSLWWTIRLFVCVCFGVNLVKDILVHMSSIFLKKSYGKISGLAFQKSMKYIYILAILLTMVFWGSHCTSIFISRINLELYKILLICI